MFHRLITIGLRLLFSSCCWYWRNHYHRHRVFSFPFQRSMISFCLFYYRLWLLYTFGFVIRQNAWLGFEEWWFLLSASFLLVFLFSVVCIWVSQQLRSVSILNNGGISCVKIFTRSNSSHSVWFHLFLTIKASPLLPVCSAFDRSQHIFSRFFVFYLTCFMCFFFFCTSFTKIFIITFKYISYKRSVDHIFLAFVGSSTVPTSPLTPYWGAKVILTSSYSILNVGRVLFVY